MANPEKYLQAKSYQFNIDSIRQYLKNAGQDYSDLTVQQFVELNESNETFQKKFNLTTDEKDILLKEISDEYKRLGKEKIERYFGAPTPGGLGGSVKDLLPLRKMTANIIEGAASIFGQDIDMGSEDLHYSSVLSKARDQILDESIQTDEAFIAEADGFWDSLFEGVKSIDKTGMGFLADSQVAATLNELIDPSSESYDERIGVIFSNKYINYVQDNWSAVGEGVGNILGEIAYFNAAAGVTEGLAVKSAQYLHKAFKVARKLKSPAPFVNALNYVKNGKFGKVLSTTKKGFEGLIDHTVKDVYMFGAHSFMSGESPVEGAMSGLAFGVSGTIAKNITKGLAESIHTLARKPENIIATTVGNTARRLTEAGLAGGNFALGMGLIGAAEGEPLSAAELWKEFGKGTMLNLLQGSAKRVHWEITNGTPIVRTARAIGKSAKALFDYKRLNKNNKKYIDATEKMVEVANGNPKLQEAVKQGYKQFTAQSIRDAEDRARANRKKFTEEKAPPATPKPTPELDQRWQTKIIEQEGKIDPDIETRYNENPDNLVNRVDFLESSLFSKIGEWKKNKESKINWTEVHAEINEINNLIAKHSKAKERPEEVKEARQKLGVIKDNIKRQQRIEGAEDAVPISPNEIYEQRDTPRKEPTPQSYEEPFNDFQTELERMRQTGDISLEEYYTMADQMRSTPLEQFKSSVFSKHIKIDPKTGKMSIDMEAMRKEANLIHREYKLTQKQIDDFAKKRELGNMEAKVRVNEELAETMEKSDVLQRIYRMQNMIEQKFNLHPELKAEFMVDVTSESSRDDINLSYGVLKATIERLNSTTTIETMENIKRKFINRFDYDPDTKRSGYNKFFNKMTAKSIDLKMTVADSVKAFNNSISDAIESEHFSDFLEKVKAREGELYKYIASEEMDKPTKNLYRAIKSGIVYGKDNNLRLVTINEKLNLVDIDRINPNKYGELNSFINELWGSEITKVQSGTHDNIGKYIVDVDFAALEPEKQIAFITKMAEQGNFMLFSKGSTAPMIYFSTLPKVEIVGEDGLKTKIDFNKYLSQTEGDNISVIKELLTKELGGDVVKEIEKGFKKSKFEEELYWKFAANSHLRLKELLGNSYREWGELNGIEDINKRFQIMAAQGLALNPGELTGYKYEKAPLKDTVEEVPDWDSRNTEPVVEKWAEQFIGNREMFKRVEEKLQRAKDIFNDKASAYRTEQSKQNEDAMSKASFVVQLYNRAKAVIESAWKENEYTQDIKTHYRLADKVEGMILADKDMWQVDGIKKRDLDILETDGAAYFHPELYDKLVDLMGYEGGKFLKAFFHEVDPVMGAMGFKGGIFKADKEQTAFMEKNGIKWVAAESAIKYRGSRKLGDKVSFQAPSLKVLFEDHNPFRKADGSLARSKALIPKQLLNVIGYDKNDIKSIETFKELRKAFDAHANKVVEDWYNNFDNLPELSKIIKDYIDNKGKYEELENLSRETEGELVESNNVKSPTEKAIMAMGVNAFTINIPFVKNYVNSVLRNHFFKNISQPEVLGFTSVIHPSSKYGENLKDDECMLGEEARDMSIQMYEKDYQTSTLGDIWDTLQILKGKDLDITKPIGKQVKKIKGLNLPDKHLEYRTIEELEDALKMVIVRTPMSNPHGARALKFVGFAGENSGTHLFVSPKNMERLGGADHDGDKANVLSANKYSMLAGTFDFFERHKDWATPDNNENIKPVEQRIKEHGDRDKSLSTDESKYNIDKMVESVVRNINGKKNLERIAGMMKRQKIAFAHGINLKTDLRIAETPTNSILGSKYKASNKRYVISITGSRFPEVLNGTKPNDRGLDYNPEVYEEVYNQIKAALTEAREKNPNIVLASRMIRGVDEIAIKAAIELGIKVEAVLPKGSQAFYFNRLDNNGQQIAAKELDNLVELIKSNGSIHISEGGDKGRQNAIKRMTDEVWTMDFDDKSFESRTETKDLLEGYKGLKVDLISKTLKQSYTTPEAREHVDHVFDFWVNYAADSQKYGGMPPWEQVQAEIFGELYQVKGKIQKWLMGNRLGYHDSKMGLISRALRALEGGKNEEGETITNRETISTLLEYKKAFPESATMFEHAMHKIVNTDVSLLRHVDLKRKKEIIHDRFGLPEGALRYQEFLYKHGWTTDEAIARRRLDGEINAEALELLQLYNPAGGVKFHNQIVKLGKDAGLKDMSEPFKTTKEYDEIAPRILIQIADYLNNNKGEYRKLLSNLKYTAENMMFKDIHAYASYTVRNELRDNVLTSYGQEEGNKLLKDINERVTMIRAAWNEASQIKQKDARNDAIETAKELVRINAPVDSKALSDYYYWRFIDAIGGWQGRTDRGRFSSELPKLLFQMDFIPVDVMNKYGKVAAEKMKEFTGAGQGKTPSVMFGMGLIPLGEQIDGGFFKKWRERNQYKLKTYAEEVYGTKRKKGEQYIDDFLKNWKNLSELAIGGWSPRAFIEDVIGRDIDSLEHHPMSGREMQSLIEAAKMVESADRLIKSYSKEEASKFVQYKNRLVEKYFLPRRVLEKSGIGRKGIQRISDVVHNSEKYFHFMNTVKDDIVTSLNNELQARAKGQKWSKERMDAEREILHEEFKAIIEAESQTMRDRMLLKQPETVKNAINAWFAKQDALDGKSIIEFSHDILDRTRKLKVDILPRIILNKAKSRLWGAQFLGLPQKYVNELSEMEYQVLLKKNIFGTAEEPEMGVLNHIRDVGTIENYYPHRGLQTIESLKESAMAIQEQDMVWQKLHQEGGVSASELRAILTRINESGHGQERTKDINTEPVDVESDLRGYFESIVRPYTRMQILKEGQDMVEQMLEAKMTEPEHAKYIERMSVYIEDLVQHTMGGSQSKEYSLYEDIMRGITNTSFGTLIGLNVASGVRNMVQRAFAVMDTGWNTWHESAKWRNGELKIGIGEDGKAIRTFDEVKREFGIEYGLANQAKTEQMELYISQAMKEAKLDIENEQAKTAIQIIKDKYSDGELDVEQRDSGIKLYEKFIENNETKRKLMDKTGTLVDKTRQFAEYTGNKGLLGMVIPKFDKLSFQQIEQGNRLHTAAAGYYRAYKEAEAEYKRNPDIYSSYKNADAYAHERGLIGARKLVELTQFEYHSFNAPEGMRTPGQKAFFQFRSYTWNWTDMVYQYLNKGILAARYGGDTKLVKRSIAALMFAGIAGLADNFWLQGLNNSWQAEPIDKILTLAELISGKDDAAWGKGWAGFIQSFPGAGLQAPIDFMLNGIAQNAGNNPITGRRTSWDYHMKRKYGILAGETEVPYWLGSFYAGVTPSRILYETTKDKPKGAVEILSKTLLGVSSRYNYTKKRRRKIAY